MKGSICRMKHLVFRNSIFFSFRSEWKNYEVEVIVNSLENKPKKPKLDEFFGKLEWQGDPLTLQREMRNEWSN